MATVDVGAVTFENQAEIIEDHVKDAVDKGAKVLTGGKRREGQGRFWEPTVLVDVDHSMKIMTEETFGPTLPIMKVRDEEEAVEKANDSRYGLNSSVFTKDIEKGERIARRIEAGSTCVNDCITNYTAQELPFGGMKESGIGVRHSEAGIQKYCNPHSILITRFAGKREPYYFPYSKTRDEAARAPDGADVRARLEEEAIARGRLTARCSPRTRGHALVGRVRLPRRPDGAPDGRARGDRDLADGGADGDRAGGVARGEPAPDAEFIPYAAAAGLAGVCGLAAFYRGLATGKMSVVAPISSMAVLVPVSSASRPATGRAPCRRWAPLWGSRASCSRRARPLTRPSTTSASPQVSGLALLSGLAFGSFFVGMDVAADHDPLWANLVNRGTSLSLAVLAFLLFRPGFGGVAPQRDPRRSLRSACSR